MAGDAGGRGDEGGVRVSLEAAGVAVVEFERPPSNHFDLELITRIVDAYEELEDDPRCRVIVMGSSGKHFCAGADFGTGGPALDQGEALYGLAARLVGFTVPVVAAVQGRAVGAGLGLALTADFRIASPETKFVCNFARLGIHHGFGISATLPAVVGQQQALRMLYTGATVEGEEAARMGLCDQLASLETLRAQALAFAGEIAASAPLAVRSIRHTMRGHLAEAVRAATSVELRAQLPLFGTQDFQEGVRAATERRTPSFTGN